ncbi:MAG: sulfatase-like hydrolase/transferase [Myxococcales bacterium]|nr:sulfatase-like hydrolase/transferase [Myxococcales bacterium]
MPLPTTPWHHKVAFHALAALLLSAVVHRLRLASVLSAQIRRAGLVGDAPSLAAWQYAWGDLLISAGFAIVILAIGRFARRRWLSRRLFIATVVGALLAVGLVRISHLGLLVALRSGLTFRLLADAILSGDGVAVVRETPTTALLWALLPAGLFGLFSALPARGLGARLALPTLVLAAAVGMTVLSASESARGVAGMPDEAAWPPEGFVVFDTALELQSPAFDDGLDGTDDLSPPEVRRAQERMPVPHVSSPDERLAIGDVPLPSEVSAAVQVAGRSLAHVGLRWADPRVVSTDRVPTAIHRQPPTNVVWIVMESTGTRYAMGERFKSRPPMPFLQELAAGGWYLSNHRSPSNSSATSIMAQMSGLLPLPSMRMMSVRKGNFVPGLPRFLPGWDQFLVTPGKLSYFFPRSFFVHNGMTELTGFHELPTRKIRAKDRLAKDEIATVDYFLQRLSRAKEPFFGMYYSYMPHWEYTDYGRKWRRYRGPRLIDHYHNGLWLLDHQLRRIIAGLRDKGVLDRTLVVLVGDHGEAFGQHKKNWAHAKGSWEENLQTPAILWSPKLLKPRTFRRQTSHIDLLPTVLDLLGKPYEPRLIQGESLLQQSQRRTVSLHWGNEGTVTAIGVDGTKVQVSTTQRWCRAYDLKRDPRERRPRRCTTPRRKALRRVLRGWVRTQRRLLKAYNAAARQGLPFGGLRHPGLGPLVR